MIYIKIIIVILYIIILINKYRLKHDYTYNKINININANFIIIQKQTNFSPRGLLSYYYHNLGCTIDYIHKGYIPIIDLKSHPNMFNGFNTTFNDNPWETFFYQPFNLKLNDVLNKSLNNKFVDCDIGQITPSFNIYYNKVLMNFWHNMARMYIPIKEEYYKEAKIKSKKLFKNSRNILGVLIRGTDYINIKPFGHPIQPSPETVLDDIKKMNNKYKYDYIFLTTEDDLIRQKFINIIGKKLKYIKCSIINYNYNKKEFLACNKNINISHIKIYLVNIIILSKCLDIIVSKTGGSIVTFIITKGFRHIKVYNLGTY